VFTTNSSTKERATKRQHYIPKFYLKRFCNDRGFFSVYDRDESKHHKKCIPRNYAVKNNFYNATEEELRVIFARDAELFPEINKTINYSDKTALEKRFAYFEGKFSEILQNIDKDYNYLQNETTKVRLSVLMHELSLRTPRYRGTLEYLNSVTYNHLKAILPKQTDTPEVFLKEYMPGEARIQQLERIVSLDGALSRCLLWLDNYDWYVGVNNTDLPFITTDDPIFYLSFGIKDFCFPISNNKAIVLRSNLVSDNSFSLVDANITSNQTINLSISGVVMYNYMNMIGSHRFVFGESDAIRQMLRIFKIMGISLIPERIT
jgi:hypothetical protein